MIEETERDRQAAMAAAEQLTRESNEQTEKIVADMQAENERNIQKEQALLKEKERELKEGFDKELARCRSEVLMGGWGHAGDPEHAEVAALLRKKGRVEAVGFQRAGTH